MQLTDNEKKEINESFKKLVDIFNIHTVNADAEDKQIAAVSFAKMLKLKLLEII